MMPTHMRRTFSPPVMSQNVPGKLSESGFSKEMKLIERTDVLKGYFITLTYMTVRIDSPTMFVALRQRQRI